MSTSLTFKFIANACGIFIGKNATRILCDPWLVDGVFDGSWCHFSKLRTTLDDIRDVDAVYISHLHPDHFDERFFSFDKSMPLIVLDHGPNFLVKKLRSLGYTNLVAIKDGQTVNFREFSITLFAPFAKHNFHEASVGNLIDSAMLISCDGFSALNANDNTPSVESAELLRRRFGPISLAMLNYNAAGPYPSCFDNLNDDEKRSEHRRILQRNFDHLKALIQTMRPRLMLPFAGAYVLGGRLSYKNKYLGTTTWDECAAWLNSQDIGDTKIVLLQENDCVSLDSGQTDKPYLPIDTQAMTEYIANNLQHIKYPYELEAPPDQDRLILDIELASDSMQSRMRRFGIRSTFCVVLNLYGKRYSIYPSFSLLDHDQNVGPILECKLDERLLRNILDRKSHWNNAEIGAHIDFIRSPNIYEPDLHMGLQFFHI